MKKKPFMSYLKTENLKSSFYKIAVGALGGMAQGLFASLLIGTIMRTMGNFIPGTPGELLIQAADFTREVQGSAMALGIGYSMKCPPYVLYSLATVGYAANSMGGGGGPLAVYIISLIAIFAGSLVSKRTGIDLLLTPSVTILSGVAASGVLAPPIGGLAVSLGRLIIWATDLQPFLMGMINSVAAGIILTLPISSAAICAALGLVGLAGGAATAGCCAHMVGFAVCSYKDNKLNGLASIGIGTSMLLVPNLVKKPILWIPPVIASAITGPLATCVFKLSQNGEPISSGMGTAGLVGPIGIVTGWIHPSEKALEMGLGAIHPAVFDWAGLVLICFFLPALISWLVSEFMRKKGWIKAGDYKLI